MNSLLKGLSLLVLVLHAAVAQENTYPIMATKHRPLTLTCIPPDVMSGPRITHVVWRDWVHNTSPEPELIYDSELDDYVISTHPMADKYTVDGASYNLRISNMTDTDVGQYMCMVTLQGGDPVTYTYTVAMFSMPTCSGNVELRNHDVTTLSCNAELVGSASPVMQWYNSSNVVQESRDNTQLGTVGRTLHITAKPRLDQEMFVCKVSAEDVHEQCSLTLSVIYNTSEIDFVPSKSEYYIGEELQCSANGNPAPRVSWSVGEDQATIKHGQGWQTLVIPDAWAKTQQTLTCTAHNSPNGKQSQEVTAQITISVSAESINDREAEDTSTAGTASASTSPAMIGGVIAAVIVVIVIIAIILVVKKRNKKPEGAKTIPTQDDEEKKMAERNGPQKGGPQQDPSTELKIPDYSSRAPNSLDYAEIDFSATAPRQQQQQQQQQQQSSLVTNNNKNNYNMNNPPASATTRNPEDQVIYADIRH